MKKMVPEEQQLRVTSAFHMHMHMHTRGGGEKGRERKREGGRVGRKERERETEGGRERTYIQLKIQLKLWTVMVP